jgi:hypothetical protein
MQYADRRQSSANPLDRGFEDQRLQSRKSFPNFAKPITIIQPAKNFDLKHRKVK